MRGATSGSRIATNTDATTPRMPDANATKPTRAFGLTAKIFVASTLLVVAVLGITFGVTYLQANRTADASIHRALLGTRRAVDDYLAARTRTLERASTVATDVPFFALDTLNKPVVVGSTVPAQDIGPSLQNSVKKEVLAADSGGEGMALAASLGNQHLIGLAGAIRSPSGDVRGGFVALRSRESELAAFNALQRTMLYAIALGVVLALIFAFVQARQIAGPVRRLVVATRQVQGGDYSVDIAVKSRDEIGLLANAFRGLVEDLKAKDALVEYMMAASGSAAT